MRSVTRRSIAAAAGILVAGGLLATQIPASAESAGKAAPARPKATPGWPGRSTPAAAPGTGSGPVELIVGLKPGAKAAAAVAKVRKAAGVSAAGAEAPEPIAALDAVTVAVPAAGADAAIAALRDDAAVEYVERNGTMRAFDKRPNDPDFTSQWGLAKMRLPKAWDVTTGSAAVTIAVLDTGVAPSADLEGALLPGYDFINDDADPTDDNGVDGWRGHGTYVAHLTAARANNGIEGAGACWSCKIMPVKVLNAIGLGDWDKVASGIVFAADNGAKVINLSLGGEFDSNLVRDAVAYARSKKVIVVAAAGNEETEIPSYPAAYPGVIAVGATNEDDLVYQFSNYGDWVDVAAPGWFWARNDTTGATKEAFGTSFSSPLVAGTVGLALTMTPGATEAKVTSALKSSAVKIDWIDPTGGRVDAAATLASPHLDVTKPKITGTTPAYKAKLRGTITVTASGVSDYGSGVREAQLYADGKLVGTDKAAPYAVKYNTGKLNKAVTLRWKIIDRAGLFTTLDRLFYADNVAPAVSISSAPKNGAKVKGVVKITAKASDKYGVTRVELLVNGKKVATDTKAAYTFSITASKYPKTIKIQVRAYDAAGNVRYAPARTWKR